jgi:AAA+ ATPase superfamily predicted ATPase
VIYGRRRVGKTTLIKEYIKEKSAIYFLVTLETENMVLRRFQNLIADFFDDEFQYLSKIDSTTPSLFSL